MDRRNSSEISNLLASKRRTILKMIWGEEYWDVFPPVHSFRKPLEDANKIVASVNSLFFPREDSRSVNHCDALQHWAFYDGALEPERTRKNINNMLLLYIMESSFKWQSTCWGMLLRIWWEVWIGVTCRQPKRSRESPAIPTLVLSILRKWVQKWEERKSTDI